jgi:hypothetical protein
MDQVRIFFRLIEFSAGRTSSNPLPFHESYFYALEAVPMVFAILCYNITHPGTILKGPEAELPSLWGMAREKLCCGRRGKRGNILGDEDGEELVSKYAMLNDGKAPPRYSAGFVEMDGSPPPARELEGSRMSKIRN